MAIKKLTFAQQMKELKTIISERDKTIEALKKDVEAAHLARTHSYAALADEKRDLAQVQNLLDALPNAPLRRGEQEWTDRSVVVRFAAWMAARLS